MKIDRLCRFVLNLYFIFTGIFILLGEPLMIFFYWVLSWLLYIYVSILGEKNGKNN